LTIDFAPVRNREDQHGPLAIIRLIDDPIACEFHTTGRASILLKVIKRST
jgi:hypothetical protein